jgi:hypothetical protein
VDRYILDHKTGVYLLYPDIATLTVISEVVEDGKAYVSASIAMSGGIDDLAIPKPNREITLVDAVLDVARPVDLSVFRFKYVKKEELTGSLTLVCAADGWANIKQRIRDESGYLPISYKGTSEEYWVQRKIASMVVNSNDLQELRSLKLLYSQLNRLRSWMSERTPITGSDLEEWLQQTLDLSFPIHRPSGSFLVDVPDSEIQLDCTRVMETVSQVSGSYHDIRIKWAR